MASILQTTAPLRAPQTTTDFVGLAELRSRAAVDSDGAARETARQFEALFVQMMLKTMRSASDVFGDGSDTTYRDMFDQQISLEMTQGKGLGLADLLTRQLASPAQGGKELRQLGAQDFVAARGLAVPAATPPPPFPLARMTPLRADIAALLDKVSLPAFAPADPPAAGATAASAAIVDAANTGSAATASPGAGASQDWADWRPATPEEFIRDVWPHAQSAGEKLGVDPRAIVAQAALETGWGRHVSRDGNGASGNNPFNIKADSRWSGERVTVRTLEFEGGLPKQKVAAFRAYSDLGAAFKDYVDFLQTNPRYADALQNGARAGEFADSLQRAGYATDPAYASKLRSIMASPRFNDLIGSFKNLGGLPKL